MDSHLCQLIDSVALGAASLFLVACSLVLGHVAGCLMCSMTLRDVLQTHLSDQLTIYVGDSMFKKCPPLQFCFLHNCSKAIAIM